jgi:selenocysteine lyase/cysteine desulfurase
MPQPLDLDFVRAQFPAFAEPSLQGQAFFENAGGSYTCKPVIDRLTRFYTQRKVQPYGVYEASRLGGEEMDEARTRLAAMLGVDTDELSFGPSTTQNTYVLAQAFGEWMGQGEAIIVTDQDHEANSGPWRRLAARASRSGNGGSTVKRGFCGWRTSRTCSMRACDWCVSRIVPTSWGRSTR